MEREIPKVTRGAFLVATPHLRDPNFRQTVVRICEHGSGGSLGLVVNRGTDQHIREVLPQATGLYDRAGCVYVGGPGERENLLFRPLPDTAGSPPVGRPVPPARHTSRSLPRCP